jgi:MFS family permease
VAGVFADRWDRRTAMVITNLLLAAGLLPLLAVHEAGQVWLCYLVVLVQSCLEQFFLPAQSALLPQLVAPDELLSANALNGQNKDVARLIGSALGGLAVGLGGARVLAIADLGTFLAAAGLIAGLRFRPVLLHRPSADRPSGDRPAGGVPAAVTGLLEQWRAGLALCARQPSLRVLLLVVAISGVGEGVLVTLFPPFVRDVLHGDGSAYGAIFSVQAIGGIAGGFLAARLGHRFPMSRLLGWGAIGIGFIDMVIFLYPLIRAVLWPAFVLMVLVGFPAAVAIAGLTTMLQSATDDAHRGRVFGAVGAVQAAAMVLGILAAGLLADVLPVIAVITVQAAGWTTAGLVVLLAPQRSEVEAGWIDAG